MKVRPEAEEKLMNALRKAGVDTASARPGSQVQPDDAEESLGSPEGPSEVEQVGGSGRAGNGGHLSHQSSFC